MVAATVGIIMIEPEVEVRGNIRTIPTEMTEIAIITVTKAEVATMTTGNATDTTMIVEVIIIIIITIEAIIPVHLDLIIITLIII